MFMISWGAVYTKRDSAGPGVDPLIDRVDFNPGFTREVPAGSLSLGPTTFISPRNPGIPYLRIKVPNL